MEIYRDRATNPSSVLDAAYAPPEWLRYARTVCFDGYSPPLYPSIKDFDAERLARMVVELGANLLRFQPIGYWAYFPSRHFRVFPELDGRDLIEEVAHACRKRGLQFYCYTGYAHPHMEPEWLAAHPEWGDWVCRNLDGTPRGGVWHYGSSWRLAVHHLGQRYRQAIRGMVEELCAHDTDGVYFDAPTGMAMYMETCFCEECRGNFKQHAGMDIERLADERDREAHVAWRKWTYEVLQEDLLDFRRIIHGSGKFMLCHNGGTWTYGALRQQYHIPDGFMIEFTRQTCERVVHGLMGASMARPRRQLSQMYVGSYDVTDFTKAPQSTRYHVHNTNLEDGDEIVLEGMTSLACGTVPLYCMVNRLFYGLGEGSAEPIHQAFALQERYEALLKDSVPVAQTTIVPSWDSLKLCQSGRKNVNLELSEAMGLALLDERLAFDVNANLDLTPEWLADQKVLILCGASAVGDEEAALLTEWVRAGGNLLATWDTGMFDAEGQPRGDGGALREVLGVEFTGEPLEDQPDIYVKALEAHPALGGLRPGELMMGDGRNVPVAVRPGARVLAETWDLGYERSRGPAMVLNEVGKGRTIYISGGLEGYYPGSRVGALRRLLGAAVRWLGGDAPAPFELSAPRGVYGILRRAVSGDLVLWLLAPVGFKDAAVGRMRQEYVPLGNIEARVRVPDGCRVAAVRLLRSVRTIPFEMRGQYAVATIPVLHIAEAVHVELERA